MFNKNVEGNSFFSKLFVTNCIDLLPDQDQLQLLIQHKQTNLSIEKQLEVTRILLDHIKNDTPLDRNSLLQCIEKGIITTRKTNFLFSGRQ